MAHTPHGHPPAGPAHATHAPTIHDPEHDIDARSATIWFIFGTLAVFSCLWIMVPIFVRVQEAERVRKVDEAPNTELLDVKKAEMAFLKGDNPSKKSIDQVLQQLSPK